MDNFSDSYILSRECLLGINPCCTWYSYLSAACGHKTALSKNHDQISMFVFPEGMSSNCLEHIAKEAQPLTSKFTQQE